MLEGDFTRVLDGTDLSRCEQVELLLDGQRRAPGIYWWVMRHNDLRYRIYAGKTRSMALRVHNYISACQSTPQ